MIGRSCSAMASRGSGVTSGRPSARARVFCSSMAWRTAGIPPRSSCSATGSCSGGARPGRRCGRRSTRPGGGGCPGRRVSRPPGRAGPVRRRPAGPIRARRGLPSPRPPRARVAAPLGAAGPGRRLRDGAGGPPADVAPSRPVDAVVAPALGLAGQHDVDVGALLRGADDLDPLGAAQLGLPLGAAGRSPWFRRASSPPRPAGPTPRRTPRGPARRRRCPGAAWPRRRARSRWLGRLTGEFDFDAMAHTGRQATAAAGPARTSSAQSA